MESQREDNRNDPNFQNMEIYCKVCNEEPCFCYQFQDQVIAACEFMEFERGSDNASPPMTNNERRKLCYREFTRAIHGSLGVGNRVQLPACVVQFVRDKYPDENNSYMGFKDM